MSVAKTVLHAEDDKMYAGIIRKALEADGFQVVHVLNGEELLRRAVTDAPDVILLDIGLPNKDGFEVLQELKADEVTRDIPVLMLTRLSSREDVKPCYEHGCAEYLIKTQHSPEEVSQHVRRVLRLKSGFSKIEALIVFGVILLMGGLLYWQLSHPRPPVEAPSIPNEVQLEP